MVRMIRKAQKKAQISLTTVLSIVKLIFTVFVALVIVAVIFASLKFEVETGIPKARISVQKLLFSKSLVMNNDELNTYYPGIIDLNNFNEENINKAIWFSSDNNVLAMNITLYKINNKRNVVERVRNVIFNKKHFKDLKTRSYLKGKGSTKSFILTQPVLILDNNDLTPGYLRALVIVYDQ